MRDSTKLSLRVISDPVFRFAVRDKAISLAWHAETEVENIIWMRLVTIKWRWPPIGITECFTDKEE